MTVLAAPPTDRIGRIRFDVSVATRVLGERVQDRLSAFRRGPLGPILERCLAESCPPEARTELGRLEIDLGEIPLEELEEAIESGLRDKLPSLLRWSFQAAPASSLVPADDEAFTEVRPADASALLAFVEHGTVDPALGPAPDLDRTLEAMLAGERSRSRAFARRLVAHPEGRRRLARQFRASSLRRLRQLLAPGRAVRSAVPPEAEPVVAQASRSPREVNGTAVPEGGRAPPGQELVAYLVDGRLPEPLADEGLLERPNREWLLPLVLSAAPTIPATPGIADDADRIADRLFRYLPRSGRRAGLSALLPELAGLGFSVLHLRGDPRLATDLGASPTALGEAIWRALVTAALSAQPGTATSATLVRTAVGTLATLLELPVEKVVRDLLAAATRRPEPRHEVLAGVLSALAPAASNAREAARARTATPVSSPLGATRGTDPVAQLRTLLLLGAENARGRVAALAPQVAAFWESQPPSRERFAAELAADPLMRRRATLWLPAALRHVLELAAAETQEPIAGTGARPRGTSASTPSDPRDGVGVSDHGRPAALQLLEVKEFLLTGRLSSRAVASGLPASPNGTWLTPALLSALPALAEDPEILAATEAVALRLARFLPRGGRRSALIALLPDLAGLAFSLLHLGQDDRLPARLGKPSGAVREALWPALLGAALRARRDRIGAARLLATVIGSVASTLRVDASLTGQAFLDAARRRPGQRHRVLADLLTEPGVMPPTPTASAEASQGEAAAPSRLSAVSEPEAPTRPVTELRTLLRFGGDAPWDRARSLTPGVTAALQTDPALVSELRAELAAEPLMRRRAVLWLPDRLGNPLGLSRRPETLDEQGGTATPESALALLLEGRLPSDTGRLVHGSTTGWLEPLLSDQGSREFLGRLREAQPTALLADALVRYLPPHARARLVALLIPHEAEFVTACVEAMAAERPAAGHARLVWALTLAEVLATPRERFVPRRFLESVTDALATTTDRDTGQYRRDLVVQARASHRDSPHLARVIECLITLPEVRRAGTVIRRTDGDQSAEPQPLLDAPHLAEPFDSFRDLLGHGSDAGPPANLPRLQAALLDARRHQPQRWAALAREVADDPLLRARLVALCQPSLIRAVQNGCRPHVTSTFEARVAYRTGTPAPMLTERPHDRARPEDAAGPFTDPVVPETAPPQAVDAADAGLVLLWPFIEPLLQRVDLVTARRFRDRRARERAVLLLRFLATGEPAAPEPDLTLHKVLCGADPVLSVPPRLDLTHLERATGEELLQAVPERWAPLRNTTIAGLRETFLQRMGRLSRGDDRWTLEVTAGPFDMLLDSLPWPLSPIRLPWMPRALHVRWRR